MTIFTRRGVLWADFRSEGYGQRSLGLPAGVTPEGRAWKAAQKRLEELRPRAQVALDLPAAGTIRAGVVAFLNRAKFRSLGTRRFYRGTGDKIGGHCAAVIRELGARLLRDFEPPAGTAELERYRDALRERVSAHTVQHRFCVLHRVFRAARAEGWMRAAPEFPCPALDGEKIYVPLSGWISEALFWRIHDEILPNERALIAAGKVELAERLQRRRLYLIFLFYTGSHKEDADTLRAAHVSTDFGTFLRRNTKGGEAVEPAWQEMPTILRDAMKAEELRRDGFRYGTGEAPSADGPLVMGPWPEVAAALRHACDRLGVAHADTRTFRRSHATIAAMNGIPEHVEVAALGHLSSRMVREVYRKIPRAQLDSVARAFASHRPAPVENRPQILPFEVAGRVRLVGLEAEATT